MDERDGASSTFLHFFQADALFDRLLHGLVLYFCALFQLQVLSHLLERSRSSHGLEGGNPQQLAARLAELQAEVELQRSRLSPPYCQLILQHSSYKRPQQDK